MNVTFGMNRPAAEKRPIRVRLSSELKLEKIEFVQHVVTWPERARYQRQVQLVCCWCFQFQ